jgi:hypothetical protein
MTHEDDQAAAFTGPEASRTRVIDAHHVCRERASFSEPDELEWISAQVNTARDRHFQIAGS